ncbi:hypothetical protein [Pimelobacter simplex]|uniref:hypothetical protein n=1 Tax=Nocardioides simplex TaxID=2045 RepID=UPI003AADAC8D
MRLTMRHLHDENADDVRRHMVVEFESDRAGGRLYQSRQLTEEGLRGWPALLESALREGDDASLADDVRGSGWLLREAPRRTPSGGTTMAKVPHTAPDTLAMGQVQLYYLRAVCAQAIALGRRVRCVRLRESANPRPESEALVGALFDPEELLADLRARGVHENFLGVPRGANSGLGVEIAEA